MVQKRNIVCLLAFVFTAFLSKGAVVLAQDAGVTNFPFGKWPGSIYLGGTEGLSGMDSLRGFTDSLFYLKWSEKYNPDYASTSQKVIYGDDDRLDVYTVTDPDLLKLAQAACLIVHSSEISDNGDGTYTLSPVPWTTQGGQPLCEFERFAGQLRLGHCSAFLVSQDLVVTAGHCMSSCGSRAFLFGYQQTDSLTPPSLVVPADNLYFCSEVVDRVYSGDLDHCLVRLDRPVVGRLPIPIRRSGVVPDGDSVVVVGHPTTLPMKIAGGAEVKNNRGSTPWFQANTDTYGGNSGSMVVNTSTWEIEGILVRGAPDFVYDGGCASSNMVPNTGNTGGGLLFEEISKIESIAPLIPVLVTPEGEVNLNSPQYNCAAMVEIELLDIDLASTANYDLLLVSSADDSELVSLTEISPGIAIFTGSVATESGVVVKYDGQLQVTNGDLITAIYEDADDGTGSPATVQITSSVDCVVPVISNVTVTATSATWVTISFNTDEVAEGRIWLGASCGAYSHSALSAPGTNHSITVTGLAPATAYVFSAEAVDVAGNSDLDDNGGFCYAVNTVEAVDQFTEQFFTGCDLEGKTLVLMPDGSSDFYSACLYDATNYPWFPTAAALNLGDDDYQEAFPGNDQTFLLYGVEYPSVFIGSNGFVTFEEGSNDMSETLEEHMAAPPRISVFWDDLDPTQAGGVSYRVFNDRMVITWDDVAEYQTNNVVGAQLHLFFDGDITITYKTVEALDGLVGISAGAGMGDFVASDLSGYPACDLITCYADTDNDAFGAPTDMGHYEFGPLCDEYAADNNDDCDDGEPSIYPGAPEVLDDGIDQDCDNIDATCCEGLVGDVNGVGGEVPTIGDISWLVDHLFIDQTPLDCLQEADINQSGGRYPTPDDISISDISTLVDNLFISGEPLNTCL